MGSSVILERASAAESAPIRSNLAAAAFGASGVSFNSGGSIA